MQRIVTDCNSLDPRTEDATKASANHADQHSPRLEPHSGRANQALSPIRPIFPRPDPLAVGQIRLGREVDLEHNAAPILLTNTQGYFSAVCQSAGSVER